LAGETHRWVVTLDTDICCCYLLLLWMISQVGLSVRSR